MTSQQTAIVLPYPEVRERLLWISVGACRLRITRGGGSMWVAGTYDDPTGIMPCSIFQEGGTVRITQQSHNGAEQNWEHHGPQHMPTCDLFLGSLHPYRLTIETGASDTNFDLGGLPLTDLAINIGAGNSVLSFWQPNPQPMGQFEFDAGAGSVEMRALSNANCANLLLHGGAAAFTCDFSGTLQRDVSVHVSMAMSTVEILVPPSTAARILAQSVLGQISASEQFQLHDGQYWSSAACAGGRPLVTVQANLTLGSLHLLTPAGERTQIHRELVSTAR